ncbi:hypothetical protein Tdes44962_MAKER01075 [Teratosphaeria destructans]|uniref:F-box domain-containing protein n=1 Tax=Teratosphaeria destructans TaxID=418781 RepID=A0A9W7SIA2_9PEZI|nr:hypothetical protein Tdes44962_MAKER01075 [Teratosphaeria destructans]
METDIPQIRALNTVELFESILVHATAKDIISCLRVCKDWQAYIQGSLKLKEKYFLAPLATQTKISFGYTISDAGKSVDGSKITEEIPVSEFVDVSAPKDDERDEAILTSLHPLLSDLPNQLSHHHISTKHGSMTHLLQYGDGVWLEMYATQPPVQTIWVTCIVYDSPPSSYFQHEHRISNISGVRVGDIRDQLRMAVEHNYQYEQSSRVLMPPHYTGDDCAKACRDDDDAKTHDETLKLLTPLDWSDRMHVLTIAEAGIVTLAIEIPGHITQNALWTRLARGDIGIEQFEAMMAD